MTASWKGLAAEKRLDLTPPAYDAGSATSIAKLSRFFVITDVHVTDKGSPAQLFKVVTDPEVTEALLGGGKGLAPFEKGYREIVSLPSAAAAAARRRGRPGDEGAPPHR